MAELIKDDIAWATIEQAILELVQQAEPGQWKKALNGWGGLPNSHQDALARCEHAGLIDVTWPDGDPEGQERVQYKLTAAGEGRRRSPGLILSAIHDAAEAFRNEKLEDGEAHGAVEPLTDSQQQAFDYIKANPGKTGQEICRACDISAESTFTKHFVPALRPHGLMNKRGFGYFIS